MIAIGEFKSGASFNFSAHCNRVRFPGAFHVIGRVLCAMKLPSIFQFAFCAVPMHGPVVKFLSDRDVTESPASCICWRRWTKRGRAILRAADSLRGASAVRHYLAEFCARLAGCSDIICHNPRATRH